jgi:hypothetical protein
MKGQGEPIFKTDFPVGDMMNKICIGLKAAGRRESVTPAEASLRSMMQERRKRPEPKVGPEKLEVSQVA